MTSINPFAFLIGFFLRDDSSKTDYKKADIKQIEEILSDVKYAQHPDLYNWENEEVEKRIIELQSKFARSINSHSTKKSWELMFKLAEKTQSQLSNFFC
ncbi:MAG: hypothetical protein U9R03_01350 [Candidatus Aerophobetes bacterium]|nr:hypothetical protein [Candidatus Aerophobetes bacterium]